MTTLNRSSSKQLDRNLKQQDAEFEAISKQFMDQWLRAVRERIEGLFLELQHRTQSRMLIGQDRPGPLFPRDCHDH